MDTLELGKKLEQIEEQAEATLREFPNLTQERQRMIIALCRYLRTELEMGAAGAAHQEEATVRNLD